MTTTDRALQLLGLFQSRPVWTAAELAAELDVTTRTVRRDVDRLRDLGYAIGADRGHGGGYRLDRGRIVPPLLLTPDEAVAVALCLRTAGLNGLVGQDEAALRAAVKLEAGLPAAARERVAALGQAIRLADWRFAPVDADLLATLAQAVSARRRVAFDYLDRGGSPTTRRVEPHRLVAAGRRWYLSAFDLDRADWRTFRIDRLSDLHVMTFSFTVRADEPDVIAQLRRQPPPDSYPHQARLTVHVGAEHLRGLEQFGSLTPVDATTTELLMGADDPDTAAWWIARLDHPFTLHGDAAMVAALRRLVGRLDAALPAVSRAPRRSPRPASR